MEAEQEYPRYLNGHGCIFGQNLAKNFERWKEELRCELKEDYQKRMDNLEKKMDRLTWALVSVAIALTTTSLTLWITHFARALGY